MRILVVDDEPEVTDVVGELLTAVGYDVRAVTSGDEALAAVDRDAYDLVISDLHLPGWSGTDLAARIVARHPRLANRLILLTGDDSASLALPVISKPFDVDVVLGVVASRLAAA